MKSKWVEKATSNNFHASKQGKEEMSLHTNLDLYKYFEFFKFINIGKKKHTHEKISKQFLNVGETKHNKTNRLSLILHAYCFSCKNFSECLRCFEITFILKSI